MFSRIAWSYVAYMAISVMVQELLGVTLEAAQSIIPGFEPGETLRLILSMFSMYGVAFPVFVLLISRIPGWHKNETHRVKASSLFLLLVICEGISVGGNLIGNLMMLGQAFFSGARTVNPVTELVESMNLWTMVLFTVILAPVIEELMFRKFLIDRLIPFGQGFAVLVSGLSFGLFHGNFYQFFYAFGLGMLFAYLYSATGQIWYNVVLHMAVNLLGGVVPFLLMQGMDAGNRLAYFGVMLLPAWEFVAFAGTIVMCFCYFKKLPWMTPWRLVEGGAAKALLKVPGTWAFLAVCVLQFLAV